MLTNRINSFINLPDTKVDLLIKLLNQSKGKLSNKKRENHFEELTKEEVFIIENNYKEIFIS